MNISSKPTSAYARKKQAYENGSRPAFRHIELNEKNQEHPECDSSTIRISITVTTVRGKRGQVFLETPSGERVYLSLNRAQRFLRRVNVSEITIGDVLDCDVERHANKGLRATRIYGYGTL